MNENSHLVIAAFCSFTACLLHIGVILGGASWYRFFGAGERMAELAESGSYYPSIVTFSIAIVLFIWGLYGLSGAGVIGNLPFLKFALVAITAVYLTRGVAGLILPFIIHHPAIAQNSTKFWLISSSVCLLFGIFYLLGTVKNWDQLGPNLG